MMEMNVGVGAVGSHTVPPEFWAQDLMQRMKLAQPTDTARGMFFRGTLEAIQGMAPGERLVERCLKECGQDKFVDFFNYPIAQHLKILSTALPVLATRHGGFERAMRELGRRATADFLTTAAGKTMLMLVRGDARRMLSHLPSAYRVSVSFGQQSVEWLGPTQGRFIARRDFMPYPFHEGTLSSILTSLNVQGVKVQGRQTRLLDMECDFSWS